MSQLPAPALAAGLAAVGILAAAPGSVLLARAQWTSRAPTVALLLWQAVCLSAGLCTTGAAFVLALVPLGRGLPEAVLKWFGHVGAGAPFRGLPVWRSVLLVLALLFAGYLLVVLLLTLARVEQRRRRHRQVLDLITHGGGPGDGPTVRLLPESAPLAWTVPGRRSRLVLTEGLLDLLTDRQLLAVLAHERAHLSVRHDLLLIPFQAWATALPVPGMRAARSAVEVLVEMQADDVAASTVGRGSVASAIAAVVLAVLPSAESRPAAPPSGPTGAAVPSAPPLTPPVGGNGGGTWGGPADSVVARRVRRLQHPAPLSRFGSTAVLVGAAVLLAVPAVVLFVGWR